MGREQRQLSSFPRLAGTAHQQPGSYRRFACTKKVPQCPCVCEPVRDHALKKFPQQNTEVRHGFTGWMGINEAFAYPLLQSVCSWTPVLHHSTRSWAQGCKFSPVTSKLFHLESHNGRTRKGLPAYHWLIPLPAGMFPPHHVSAYPHNQNRPPKYALSPVSSQLHPPVWKTIIITYCPRKEKTHFFHFCLVIQLLVPPSFCCYDYVTIIFIFLYRCPRKFNSRYRQKLYGRLIGNVRKWGNSEIIPIV